jgi:hypothetical protein
MNGAPGHLILFHPAYRRGGPAIEFPAESSIARYGEPVHNTELDDSNVAVPASADYEDPVSTAFPEYRGRWIAAFAPVGNTGFFLVVQQRVEDALNVDPFVSWNVAVGIAIVMTFIIAIAVALLRRRH